VKVMFLLFMGAVLLILAPPASAAIKSISADDLDTSYVYTGGVGTLAVNDTAVIDVEYLDTTHTSYNGTVVFSSILLVNERSGGNQAGGDFAGGQLYWSQGATDLLTCSLLALSLDETSVNSNILAGGGTFQVVSGTLMPDFGNAGDIFMMEFRLSVGITSFYQSFTGRSDVSMVPVPEPATVTLLGLGASALMRRKRI